MPPTPAEDAHPKIHTGVEAVRFAALDVLDDAGLTRVASVPKGS
jgi:hypothetical protein